MGTAGVTARRTALVTGASSDIGRAIARRLAAHGANVVVHYVAREAEARTTAEEVRAAGGEALLVRADVGKEDEVRSMFRAAMGQFGGIDVLVNAAASRRDGPAVTTRTVDWDATFATNARGTFLCIREALARMTRNKYGRIVNVISVAALTGWVGQASYASSKSAVIGLTMTIAREYGRYGVTCNAVAPGLIDTTGVADLNAQARKSILDRTIAGRPGTSDEVAHAVAFLASDEAAYITGQVLAVDGGLTL